MPNDPNRDTETVETAILDYFPKSDMDFYHSLRIDILNYNVEAIFPNPKFRPPGGIPIRLRGRESQVRACLWYNWIRPAIENDPELTTKELMDSYLPHLQETQERSDEELNLRWDEHWARLPKKNLSDAMKDMTSEHAINMLVNAGYNFDQPGVELASAYLQLAFSHCPDLMDEVAPVRTVNDYKGKHSKDVNPSLTELNELLSPSGWPEKTA